MWREFHHRSLSLNLGNHDKFQASWCSTAFRLSLPHFFNFPKLVSTIIYSIKLKESQRHINIIYWYGKLLHFLCWIFWVVPFSSTFSCETNILCDFAHGQVVDAVKVMVSYYMDWFSEIAKKRGVNKIKQFLLLIN